MNRRVIRDNKTLFSQLDNLNAGDIIIGRIRLRIGEEALLLDLVERNICIIPSARSQLCSRSKVFQARLLKPFMIPNTRAIFNRHDMMAATTDYTRKNKKTVICKLDRANGGQGIFKFPSVEDVFNQATLGTLEFPFILQPFLDDCFDVRVVYLGDTIEAYKRYNPYNFRHNLHCGGNCTPYALNKEQLNLCAKIMKRADFPYAHIDLLITPTNQTWLTEINLRGGLKGAELTQDDYLKLTANIHEDLLNKSTSTA